MMNGFRGAQRRARKGGFLDDTKYRDKYTKHNEYDKSNKYNK